MGIQGLLPLLKDIQEHTHVSQYRGQTLGIDGYVWLHRGAYACAEKLVKGEYTTKYINYAMYRIRMLRHHGVKPYVVFDGDRLPSKAHTEGDREARRKENLERAMALSRQQQQQQQQGGGTGGGGGGGGGARPGAAFEAFAKCLDITPEIAYQLIKALKAEGVEYVVAPYEADAQLAYLEKQGIIDAILTEDSDLLVFGCRNVLFKMGSDGSCIRILQSRFTACRSVSFAGWTTDRFRQMAILSGCDYLPSISGMGLKNAHKLLQRYKTVSRVLQAVRLQGRMRVPPNYHQHFEQAEKTFLYQRVWDPSQQQLTTLNPLPDDVGADALQYIGPEMSHDVARGIAQGEIDPISRRAMTDIMPSFLPASAVKGVSKVVKGSDTPGQRGIKAFFGKAAVVAAKRVEDKPEYSSSSRRPLAPRDTNVKAATTPVKSSTVVDPATTQIRSLFFGGQTKGVNCRRKSEAEAPKPATCLDPPHREPSHSPEVHSSPISGMGDFFCELDGADPRLLMSEDEGSPRPAFSNLGEERMRTHWDDERCDSEVSDAVSTPRKARSESLHFSSPLAFDEEGEGGEAEGEHAGYENQVLLGSKSGQVPQPPTPTPTPSGSGADLHEREHELDDADDILSSPSSRASETSALKRKYGSGTDGLALARRASEAEADVDEGEGEGEGEGEEQLRSAALTPGCQSGVQSASLWERFSRTPATQARSCLRTPSGGRPLRLYASSTPVEHTPFLTRSVSASASASALTSHDDDTPRLDSPLPTGRRSVSASTAASLAAAPQKVSPPPNLQAPQRDGAAAARPSLDLSYFSYDQSQSQKQGQGMRRLPAEAQERDRPRPRVQKRRSAASTLATLTRTLNMSAGASASAGAPGEIRQGEGALDEEEEEEEEEVQVEGLSPDAETGTEVENGARAPKRPRRESSARARPPAAVTVVVGGGGGGGGGAGLRLEAFRYGS